MDDKTQIMTILVILTVILVGGILLINYMLKATENELNAKCAMFGISKEACYNTMSPECANDCRILRLKEFRYDKEGYRAWACYCLKDNNDVMKIW